jgi:hypothetical protein
MNAKLNWFKLLTVTLLFVLLTSFTYVNTVADLLQDETHKMKDPG